VEPEFERGSVVLRGPTGDVSLVWADGKGPRARSLAPGEYRLRTTRVVREHEGRDWFLSSTGPLGPTRTLRAGETAKVEGCAEVRFQAHARRRHAELQLGFSVTGADGRGLSVYRDGRRVDVSYEVVDGAGRVLSRGTMQYG